MTKNTAQNEAKGATPCECSRYEAQITAQLTEENLANGTYETFTTGCNATTAREFAPGHDAKLKSFLIRHSGPEYEIRFGASVADAKEFAKRYAFGYMVLEGIAKAEAKAAAKAEREAARAAKKAEKAAAKAKPAAPAEKPLAEVVAEEEAKHAAEVAAARPEPEWDDEPAKPVADGDDEVLNARAREEREADLVTAKVGRWEYQGFVTEEGGFRYRNKGGHLITAPKGTYKLV